VDTVFEVIEGLHRDGVSVLLVEQNVGKALGIASRAYILAEGRIIATGAPSDLLQQPDLARAYLGWGQALQS
jgi:branched-chain amino acid transport system ATP-binding protein